MLRFSHFDKTGGVRYGMSTRADGSMNVREFSRGTRENAERYFAEQNIVMEQIAFAELVHGTIIHSVTSTDVGRVVKEVDGFITNTPNAVLALTGGDCFSIFAYAPDVRAVGIAHAGWRGVTANIAERLIDGLAEQYGADRSTMRVGIGPGICAKHFVVQADVIDQFGKYSSYCKTEADGIYVDLLGIIERQLTEAKISTAQIEKNSECTACDPVKYFSYRRDKPAIPEVMVAYIGLI